MQQAAKIPEIAGAGQDTLGLIDQSAHGMQLQLLLADRGDLVGGDLRGVAADPGEEQHQMLVEMRHARPRRDHRLDREPPSWAIKKI